ncbi:MAG: VCBS repeat-containing protein [Deltaproteobacteria bacterium]|nr:VCBS repeat-containing protein [Deltaproteobacteria bacterium]
MMRAWRGFVSLGVLLALGATSDPASADWPSARHDARRTAAASGDSALLEPTAFWRFFHGGSIGADGALFVDLDGDGSVEAILAGANGVSAKSPVNGDLLWQNGALAGAAAPRLAGLADVDGDGTPELVAHTNSRAYLLRLSDGATLWAESVGEMGTLAAIRIADLSGDGRDDLVIHECGCCAINSGKSAVVYRFAGAGASLASPAFMWSPPVSFCGGSQAATVARMRAKDKADLVFGASTRLELLDGPSGAVVAATSAFGDVVQASQCEPVEADGDGLDELLCVLSDSNGPTGNGRRVYLVDYEAAPSPRLAVVWEAQVGTQDGAVRIPPGFIADLDGDGTREVVLAAKSSPTEWSTYVFDLATGAERAKAVGAEAVGVAPILENKGNAVLTAAGGALSAYRLAPGSSGMLEARWTLAKRALQGTLDVEAGKRSSIRQRLVLLDVDGDGVDDVGTLDGVTGTLELVRGVGAMPKVVGSYGAPGASTILAAWRITSGGKPALAVAQSDGNAHVLDAMLMPVSGNASYGAQFGSYFSSSQFRLLWNHPVVGDLGDGVPGLMLVNSRGALQRLDARKASFADPPSVVWTREATRAPQLVAGLDASVAPAKPGVVAFERNLGSNDRLLALRADGSVLWSTETLGYILADMVVGKLDADAVPDVIVEHGEANDSLHRVTAYSGATGAVLWQAAPLGPGNRQPPGGALADWNGDGTPDFVLEAVSKTTVLDGKTGSVLQQSALGGDYYTPILFDVDGSGDLEVTLYAGYTAPGTINHALTSYLWQGQADDRPGTYGAMTACGSSGMLLGGSLSVPSRLFRITAGGAAAGTRVEQILGGGKAFADLAAAKAANVTLGQLGSPAIHEDLAGDGIAVAVMGSEDGWLYGVEACSGKLRFAHEIGAPVGAIAFGDTDGDGKDDLLASAADGHLYAFRQTSVAPPTFVVDTDPPNGINVSDVDAIVSKSTLYGSWKPAPGAESYEVAVVRDAVDGGGFVSAGPWTDVGKVTKAELDGLSLVDGRRYFFAVRTVAGGARSPDVLSDGVTVYLDSLPSGASSGAGGAGGDPGAGGASMASTGSGAGGGDSAGSGGVGSGGGEMNCVPSCGASCAVSSRETTGRALTWSMLALAVALLRRRR